VQERCEMRICDMESMLMCQNQSCNMISDLIQRDAEYIASDREQYINHLQKALRALKLQARSLQLDSRELNQRLYDTERQLAVTKGDLEGARSGYRELVVAALDLCFANNAEDQVTVRKWRSRVG